MDYTPEQWRNKLSTDLKNRRPGIQVLRNYHDGIHPHPSAPDSNNEAYRRLAVLGEANLCSNVIDAVAERLSVNGITFNAQDPDADEVAWRRYWQRNSLDAAAPMIFAEALKSARSFALASNVDDEVLVTAEDPTECIIAYAAGSNRRAKRAFYKEWVDPDDKRAYAFLQLPETVHYWTKAKKSARWEPWDGPDGQGSSGANAAGRITAVEFICNPTIAGEPQPELSRSIRTTQDRINKRLFDGIVVAEFQAFPQRVAIGIDIPKVDGKDVNPLKAGPEHVWTLTPNEGAEGTASVFQLEGADLRQGIDAVKFDLQMLASQSRTPLYQLAGDLVNVSADTVTALSTGLVHKVRRHQLVFGEALEELIGIAVELDGSPDRPNVDASAAEIKWVDPELRTLSERADAAVKLNSIGYGFRAIAELMGESDARINELVAQRSEDQLAAFTAALDTGQTPAVPTVLTTGTATADGAA